MREILFRGKSEYNGEWIVGSLHIERGETDRNGKANIDYRILGMRGECDYVIPETVGQFTGRTDKHGKRIFEGDICRFREWSKGEMCWVGKVHWEHQQFMISGDRNKECETMFELCMSRFIPENIEVIGNIHDNPELLEVE